MTVIAWDGRFVAADSMSTFGSSRVIKPTQKLVRSHVGDNEVVFGYAGTEALFVPMMHWYRDGAKPGEMPSVPQEEKTWLLVFSRDGAVSYTTEIPYAEQWSTPMAWGAAADHVIGGLDAGLSAGEAIESALKREIWIGGPVQVVDLNVNAEAAADQCEHSWVDASDPDIRCGKCGCSKPRVTA